MECVPGEALGNTFLLTRDEDVVETGFSASVLAQKLCPPRYDGLLVIRERALGPPVVQVINRDGTPAEVCLNGLRVVALWTGEECGTLEMAGKRIRWRRLRQNGRTEIETHILPKDLPGMGPFEPVPVGSYVGWAVPFWNPHCVVPAEDLSAVPLEDLAEAAEAQQEAFPDGVNVEAVAQGGKGTIHLRVWERGVGETKACGSGAVAAALVSWWTGEQAGPLKVCMTGGRLRIKRTKNGGIILSGGARLSPLRQLSLR